MKVIEKDIREGEREEKLLQCIGQKKREREIDCNKKHLRECFCLFSH